MALLLSQTVPKYTVEFSFIFKLVRSARASRTRFLCFVVVVVVIVLVIVVVM